MTLWSLYICNKQTKTVHLSHIPLNFWAFSSGCTDSDIVVVVHSDGYFKDRRIKSIAIHKIQFDGGDYEHEYH